MMDPYFSRLDTWDTARATEEILRVLHLPDYASNPGWYAQQHEHQRNVPFIVAYTWRDPVVLHELTHVWGRLGVLVNDISHFQMFSAKPNYLGIWHKDGADRKCAINIPLFNCDGQVDWTADDFPVFVEHTKFTSARIPTPVYNADTYKLNHAVCTSSKLNCVQLLNTDIWHRVNNAGVDAHRIVMSIRFKSNAPYERIKQLTL